MRYWKLRGAIIDKYGTYDAFAKALNIHPATLSGKLREKTDWTLPEMETAAVLLDIPDEEIHSYFFTR